jgi:hypothetical protein
MGPRGCIGVFAETSDAFNKEVGLTKDFINAITTMIQGYTKIRCG